MDGTCIFNGCYGQAQTLMLVSLSKIVQFASTGMISTILYLFLVAIDNKKGASLTRRILKGGAATLAIGCYAMIIFLVGVSS